jgi:hypothetical protein
VLRALLATFAVALALSAAAQASVKVTWPQQRTYAPGEALTVKVAADKAVRVALVRESASGRVMRTISRRTLRTGSFSAAAPTAGRYALRVGNRSRTVSIAAPVASLPLTPPPTDPTSCVQPDVATAALRLSTTTVRAGDELPYELVNQGPGCLVAGLAYSFEHQLPDGSWVAAKPDLMFAAIAVLIDVGGSFAKQAQIPADAEPGAYHLLDAGVAAPFDVTP